MFPDIALCGTTAPDPVPSSSAKTTDAFAQAFADLLVPHLPVSPAVNLIAGDVAGASVPMPNAPPMNDATAAAVAVQRPMVDDAATLPVDGQQVSLPNLSISRDLPVLESFHEPVTSDEKREERAEDPPAINAIGVPPSPPALVDIEPPSLPTFDAELPSRPTVDVDPERFPALTPAMSDVEPAESLVVEPGDAGRSIAPGVPVEPAVIRRTNATRSDREPLPTGPVHEPDGIGQMRPPAAPTGVIETPHRTTKSADLEKPAFAPRLTHPQSEAARGRLAAITALLAGVGQEPLARSEEMAPPQAVREIEPITSAARAFRAPSTDVAQMFGPDVALKENVPATSGGDPGSSLPVLHALTLRPMFAGLREAATLQPSSRSAYEVLPNESANAHSIVQTLRLQATAGGGTAVISLAPKYLGSVTVSLRVVDGGVTATLHAESPSVRAWIDANVPLLRDGLAEQGLRLERVIVAETPESRHNGEDHTRDEHERPPVPTRRPRRREDRTFDVVV